MNEKISFTLALDKDFSINESVISATEAIDRLERYIQNGHSTEGLDFEYVSVESY